MLENFQTMLNRHHTGSSKWDDLLTHFGRQDLIPLWKADTDFYTPPFILNALKHRLEHPNLGYAADEVLDEIPALYSQWSQFNFKPEDIIVSLGILPLIAVGIQAFSSPQDEIILDFPAYPGLRDIILANNRTILPHKMDYDSVTGEYTCHFDALEERITSKTKIWLLCNPHNPTGHIFTQEELKRIEQIVVKYNLIVIADEIYNWFSFSHFKHIPFASLSHKTRARTITATSPSKIFGLAGLMAAIAIIPDETIKKIFYERFMASGLAFSKRNVLNLIVLKKAYSPEIKPWFADQIQYVYTNALFVMSFIKKYLPKIIVTPPQGTFLMWLNFNFLDLTVQEIRNKMIHEAKIAMNDGATFGEDYAGFYRLNIGCSLQLLEQFCEQLKATFEQY